jgi:hypothetical protein
MRRKIVILGLIVLILMGAGIGGYYYFLHDSPRHALLQMVRAIQTQNMDKFFEIIDLKLILNNLAEKGSQDQEFVDDAGKFFGMDNKSLQPEDELSKFGIHLGKKFAGYLVRSVIIAFEPQIKEHIKNYLLNLNTQESVALTAIVTHAQIEENDGMAKVTLTNPHNGQPLSFSMVQDPNSRQWRVVEINYQDLKSIIKQKLGK